jgi:hypothetical protein
LLGANKVDFASPCNFLLDYCSCTQKTACNFTPQGAVLVVGLLRLFDANRLFSLPLTEYVAALQAGTLSHSLSCTADVHLQRAPRGLFAGVHYMEITWKRM